MRVVDRTDARGQPFAVDNATHAYVVPTVAKSVSASSAETSSQLWMRGAGGCLGIGRDGCLPPVEGRQSPLYFELARRSAGTGVIANAVNPGLVAGNFGLNNLGRWARALWPAMQPHYQLFASSPQPGARTAIYVATAPELDGRSASS